MTTSRRSTPGSTLPGVLAVGACLGACSDDGVKPLGTTNTGGGSDTTTASATDAASTTSASTSAASGSTTSASGVGTTGTTGSGGASTTSTMSSGNSTDAGTEGSASTTDGMAAGGTTGAGATTTGGDSTPSLGCGLAVDQNAGQWVEQPSLTIDGTPRVWSVWLPENYDPERAYPLVVLLHGCGGETNNVPIERESGDQAILIRGAAAQSDNCWNTQESGPNDEFFDAMLDTSMAAMCIDSERVFVAGYSSGSWLSNMLNCVRADRIRAVGTVAGGNPLFGMPDCNGNVAAIFIHDQDDNDNDISGSEAARDRLLAANGCSETTMAVSPDPCVQYQDCDPEYPILFCATSGEGHNRQDQFAAPAMWDFFSQF